MAFGTSSSEACFARDGSHARRPLGAPISERLGPERIIGNNPDHLQERHGRTPLVHRCPGEFCTR
eukprot:11786127-Alexandrium_andersonii.AAC.1